MLDTRRDENWTPTPMSAIRQAGRELRGTLQLATPIIVGHLGQNLMGVADSVMIGHVGTVPLAASAFAGALFGMMFVISIGVLSSVAVRTAMAFGAGRTHECGEIVRHGLAIATALSLFFVACVAQPALGRASSTDTDSRPPHRNARPASVARARPAPRGSCRRARSNASPRRSRGSPRWD
jgi:O-antigen/teichoic acid export membrane protein